MTLFNNYKEKTKKFFEPELKYKFHPYKNVNKRKDVIISKSSTIETCKSS